MIPTSFREWLRRWDGALVVLGFVLVGTIVLLDFGVTTDESLRMRASLGWWEALRGGGVDSYVSGTRAHYGMFFDQIGRVVVALDQSLTGTKDLFRGRHLVCMLAGAAGLWATYGLARRLAPWPAPLLAVVFVATAPRFFGSSFANPKDIPFLAAATFAMWACVSAIQKPSARSTLKVALSAGICAAVRPLGAVFFVLGAVSILAAVVRVDGRYPWDAMKPARRRGLMQVVLALGLGYVVVLALWPVLWVRPPWHLASSSVAITRHIRGSQSLFLGGTYPFNDAPGGYVAVWLAVTMPLTIVVPGVFALVERVVFVFRRLRTLRESVPWMLVLGWAVGPMFLPLVTTVTLYDTSRQLLFMVPAWAILSAHGIVHVASKSSPRWRALLGAGVALALLEAVVRLVTLHPYQNVYFNPWVGGLEGAQGRFDVAHYSETYADGFDWLEENAEAPVAVHVLGNGSTTASYLAYRHGFELNRPRFEYFLSEVRQGWEQTLPGTIVHEIEREGVPLLQIRRLDAMDGVTEALLWTGPSSTTPPRMTDGQGWRPLSAEAGQFSLAEHTGFGDPAWLAIPLEGEAFRELRVFLSFYWGAQVWWQDPSGRAELIYDEPAIPFHFRATEGFPSMLPLTVAMQPGRQWLLVEVSRTRLEWKFGAYVRAAPDVGFASVGVPPASATETSR